MCGFVCAVSDEAARKRHMDETGDREFVSKNVTPDDDPLHLFRKGLRARLDALGISKDLSAWWDNADAILSAAKEAADDAGLDLSHLDAPQFHLDYVVQSPVKDKA